MDHGKERVETGGPVGGCWWGQVRRKEVCSGAAAVEMNGRVEFRNILVELIELADKVNEGMGKKKAQRGF